MSTLKVNELNNGGSAIDFPNGFTVGGGGFVQGYTESASEPSSPTKGDIWWDTANELLYQYLNGEFKAIGIVPSSWIVDLSNVTYDNVSLSVASQDGDPRAIAFNTDGTKMYIVGSGSGSAHQYSLSTGFDLSTASYDSVSFSVASQESTPVGLVFNTDGTKMYMVGFVSRSVYQYSLSTAFDLSTASYDSVSFGVGGQDTFPLGLAFNNDGTKMYIAGGTSNSLLQYSLSTGFDLSTASYDSVSFSVGSQDGSPYDIVFNTDGTKMYMVGSGSGSVYQYSLSTAFDLSTASYDSVSFSVASQDSSPLGLAFNTYATKMYIVGFSTDAVYQYSTGL